jgi:hypothetical protein
MPGMRRREFVSLFGGAAVAWPLAARAQSPRPVPIVGLVSIAATATDAANFRGFLEQMRELGYLDGTNIVFDRRFAGGREELIDGYVADLVRRPVDVIVVTGTRGQRGRTFARPHAPYRGSRRTNFDAALSSLVADGTQGLVVSSDGTFLAHRQQLVDTTIRHRLPAIFAYRPQADAGGLMAYAARVDDLSRRAAFFVDRILKGAKPADLPIEQPTRFTLVLNLRTAKIFGLDLPAALLAQADEVIE